MFVCICGCVGLKFEGVCGFVVNSWWVVKLAFVGAGRLGIGRRRVGFE